MWGQSHWPSCQQMTFQSWLSAWLLGGRVVANGLAADLPWRRVAKDRPSRGRRIPKLRGLVRTAWKPRKMGRMERGFARQSWPPLAHSLQYPKQDRHCEFGHTLLEQSTQPNLYLIISYYYSWKYQQQWFNRCFVDSLSICSLWEGRTTTAKSGHDFFLSWIKHGNTLHILIGLREWRAHAAWWSHVHTCSCECARAGQFLQKTRELRRSSSFTGVFCIKQKSKNKCKHSLSTCQYFKHCASRQTSFFFFSFELSTELARSFPSHCYSGNR